MRHKSRLPYILALALALAIAVAPAAAGSAQPNSQVAAVLRAPALTVDAFHAALASGDKAAASAQLASHALVYESGRAERSKAEYAAHHLAADAAFASATRRIVIRRSGQVTGNLAWVATETRTVGTYKGKPINSTGTETMLLRRERPGWRIVHVHWSSADAK